MFGEAKTFEVALKDFARTFGDVYANDAGHIELQYTARFKRMVLITPDCPPLLTCRFYQQDCLPADQGWTNFIVRFNQTPGDSLAG